LSESRAAEVELATVGLRKDGRGQKTAGQGRKKKTGAWDVRRTRQQTRNKLHRLSPFLYSAVTKEGASADRR
jgi:hypothetical protein